jgi:hypothetical protein
MTRLGHGSPPVTAGACADPASTDICHNRAYRAAAEVLQQSLTPLLKQPAAIDTPMLGAA